MMHHTRFRRSKLRRRCVQVGQRHLARWFSSIFAVAAPNPEALPVTMKTLLSICMIIESL